jgi:hypothetical protein
VLDAMARRVRDTTGRVQDIAIDDINETVHVLRSGRGVKFLARLEG